MMTAFVYHGDYLFHDTGSHPENRQRLEAIVGHLKKENLWSKLEHVQPQPATEADVLTCHSKEHWVRIKELGEKAKSSGQPFRADPDTVVSPQSVEVALLAAGGAMAAVDTVMMGKTKTAFACVRPPGHHATPNRAMGFCLFNNIAIAARHAQKKHSLKKVAIIDWDVHHGNGTQEVFYADPTVFYFSVHQHPWYPGTGLASETGEGAAQGTNLNVPLPAGQRDADYERVFQEKVHPALEQFRPELLLVSAGYDARTDDPLGRMQITDAGFANLTRLVRAWADEFCRGRFVAILEGGYNLEGLPRAVAATLTEMVNS